MHSVSPPSSRVLDAVARSKGVDAVDLPPLYETIDPDALDALCSSYTNGARDDGAAMRIQFTYAGREVVVRTPDRVEVSSPDSGRDHPSTE